MHAGLNIGKCLLLGNLNRYRLCRQVMAFKQSDDLRRAILLHQRIGQQVNGEMPTVVVFERTKQRFQYLHIKTLAQVKLRNQ